MSERNLSEQATQFSIGQLIGGDAKRDAIHIAVAPVTAAQRMQPGQRIGPVGGDTTQAAPSASPIGIVDPFLTEPVELGQRFFMFLLPNTITGLRHEWTHPVFNSGVSPEKMNSEAWIRDFAASVPLSYETIMEGAEAWVWDREHNGYGEYLCFGGLLEGKGVPGAFWPHYEVVTGATVAEKHRGSFFSCAC